ncbi:MAG: right-handed parallel beta-helix repeat-containing protein, partial [Planctomycetia bacterium]
MARSSRLWDNIVSRLEKSSRKLVERRKRLSEIKSRHLQLEQCENRLLLSIVPLIGPDGVLEGEEFTLTADVDLASSETVTEWTIDWGDGTTPQEISAPESGSYPLVWSENVTQVDDNTWTFTYTYSDGDDDHYIDLDADVFNGFSTTTESIYYPHLPGDADLDGDVDGDDEDIVTENTGIEKDATWRVGDFDGDGDVDASDYGIWDNNSGATRLNTAGLEVYDVPPTFTVSGDLFLPAGVAHTVTFSVDDPGDDEITSLTVYWGDGGHTSGSSGSWGDLTYDSENNTWTATHTYTGSDRWLNNISIQAVDSDSGFVSSLSYQGSLVVSTPVDESDDGDYSDGDLSLREALGLAYCHQGVETITFDLSSPYTITLNSSLEIDSDVIIEGSATNTPIIDANNNRAFLINTAGVEATISDMTITGGSASSGGGIFVDNATLNLSGLTFEDNTATNYGGAIYGANSSVINISDSTFNLNETTNYYGGGVYATGSGTEINITGSTFTENTAGASSGNGYGGGLAVYYGATGSISNTTFSSNDASYSGGGIAVYNAEATVTIADSDFTGNEAGANGGGLYSSGSQITISDGSTFTGNVAGNYGGGISGATSSIVNISNTTFYQNETTNYYGGGVYATGSGTEIHIAGSSFTENRAGFGGVGGGGYGGGVAVYYGATGSISSTTFSDNEAEYSGGGLAVYNAESNVTVANSDFIGNEAIANGGGIYVRTSLLTISDGSTFTGNVAGNYGGGILGSTSSVVNISDTTFDQNEATNHHGGGIYATSSSIFNITGSTFTGNKAAPNITNAGYGGGLYVISSADVTVTGSTFTGNTASNRGGGVTVYDADVTISNTLFDSNVADYGGGGVYAQHAATADIEDSTFIDNEAGLGGGLLSWGSVVISITNSDF